MMLIQHSQKAAISLVKHLILISTLSVVLFPIFYIVSMSLNANGSIGSDLIPKKLSFEHWRYVLGLPYKDLLTGEVRHPQFPMMRWLGNSLKVAGLTAILVLFLSTTAAYALSRFRFAGRQGSLISLMVIQMFPNLMAMVAFYLMLDYLGDIIPWLGPDTHGGLILVYLGGTPFNIWLIKGYFDTIPKSMEESAIMDGCSRWQAFYKILLPLSAPILSVVSLLSFIGTFADYILPSILLKSQENMTFAVGIQLFISDQFANRWGQFAAACILGAVPIALVFFSIHRYIVAGLAAGGVKE